MTKRDLIAAAQRGDRRAGDELARACLPLVYNVIGRALNNHPDAEDVVQETMLRVIRDLPSLRQPESLRAWVLTIALHQVGVHQQRAAATERRVGPLAEAPDTGTDFEELAILRLRLSGERRQVAEASRWLDAEDRTVLALWWQEAAGEIDRGEIAAILRTTPAYAAVRIQRMRAQLDRSRVLVAALEALPRCPGLTEAVSGWDQRPSALWRKRIDRHVRDCQVCPSASHRQITVERLLVGCALVPVPATLTVAAAGQGGLFGWWRRSTRSNPVTVTVAAVAVIAVGGTAAYANRPEPKPTALPVAPSVAQASPSIAALPSFTKPAAPKATPSKSKAAVVVAPACGRMPNPASSSLPNPAKYTNAGGGVVRDRLTCLEWQRTPAPKTYTFTEAKAYCKGLTLDGGGWHLPTRLELSTIVDSSRSGPAINTTAFPGTPARFFWTSTAWAVTKTPLRAWIINFYEGLASNGAFQTGSFQVRCVRPDGAWSTAKYQIKNGQVTDPATGLVWQRGASSSAISASAATAYCKSLTLNGRTWRLPGLTELSSTVDDTRVAPAIDTAAFPGTVKKGYYWTSATAAPDHAQRWGLNYEDGYTNYRKITEGYARCVS